MAMFESTYSTEPKTIDEFILSSVDALKEIIKTAKTGNPYQYDVFIRMPYKLRQFIGLGEALEAKKEAEDKFKVIVNSARDAIVMTDNEDKVVFWNPSAEKMFGYTSEEMSGKVLHSIIPAQDEHKNKKENLNKFEKTGKSFVLGKTFVLPMKRKDGKTIVVELSISGVQLKGKWHAIGLMRESLKKVDVGVKQKSQKENRMIKSGVVKND